VADPTARVVVEGVDQLADGAGSVAHHLRRHALGDGHRPAVDDQDAVVAPRQVLFHDHLRADESGGSEPRARRLLVPQVGRHASAVIAVHRLGDDGAGRVTSKRRRLVCGGHHDASRHRDAGRGEHLLGRALVSGRQDRQVRGGVCHACPHQPLTAAPAEADQASLVDPCHRDAAAAGLLDEAPGGRPEALRGSEAPQS
jgi:hypothetical protein